MTRYGQCKLHEQRALSQFWCAVLFVTFANHRCGSNGAVVCVVDNTAW
jgi:hypothetical protein